MCQNCEQSLSRNDVLPPMILFFLIMKTNYLGITLDHQSCFMTINGSIYFKPQFENPFTSRFSILQHFEINNHVSFFIKELYSCWIQSNHWMQSFLYLASLGPIHSLWKITYAKPHYLATKTQKTTHIQLLCNYFLGITTIVQLTL